MDELGELIWFDPVRNEIKDTDDNKKKISCSMSDSTISVLFCCETYEISNSFSKISFSTYSGQCIEFEVIIGEILILLMLMIIIFFTYIPLGENIFRRWSYDVNP